MMQKGALLRVAACVFMLLFPSALQAVTPDELARRDELIQSLLLRLSDAKTLAEAKKLENDLTALWQKSGRPSIDLVMDRGLEAMREKDSDRAFYYFNELVILAPGYAGGWDGRAAIYIARGEREKARDDLLQSLQLEPRNFFTMRRLAGVLFALNQKEEALELYRRSLSLDPWLDDQGRRGAAKDALEADMMPVPHRQP